MMRRKKKCEKSSSEPDTSEDEASPQQQQQRTSTSSRKESSTTSSGPYAGLPRSVRRIRKAMDSARPELTKHNSWQRHDYAKNFDKEYPVKDKSVKNNIDYVNVSGWTDKDVLKFEQHYIKNKIPCVLRGGMEDWQAMTKWSKRRLLKKYRNQSFKCGEDDDGHNVKIKMKYYLEYMENTTDDSPLYIFDANYGEHKKNKQLCEDYEIPPMFKDDVFEYVSNSRRPPHRWVVIGPPRSGTGIHIDPLGTSAWNALVTGYKRWFILPTTIDPKIVKVTSQDEKDQRDEAITWFKLARERCIKQLPEGVEPIEVIQGPGEIMYVPSGWWHTVLNLTETVAVTQNFAHREHWEVNYHKAARGRPKMTQSLLKVLKEKRPELYERTKRVNLKEPSGQASSSSSDDSSSSSSSSSSSDSEDEKEKKPISDNTRTNGNLRINGTSNGNQVSSFPAKKRMRI